MLKYIMSTRLRQRVFMGIAGCFVVFILGYYVLEYISTMEDPPLGNTVYILIGSALVFSSVIGVLMIIKYLYDYKKQQERRDRRRKKHKLFYLKDQKKETDSD
ncbi:hypothetical protein [Flavobacterium sp.]|uniref:hypothetical protein n=1 Tax=Flavobacterium sp. TaxID=239 RepID=UPI002600AB6F|nr:hypothetical protein [Flavobacterium sp.]